ncbi:ABC transporter permease subunit [Streptococcus hongkongensis]|nr:membrane protein [Streptococcus uberis]
MTSLQVMLKKEWMEMIRTHKGLAILIVFAIFGILGPFTAVMMPDIMAGLLPKALADAVPDPTYLDSYNQFFKNVDQLGLVILVFLFSSTLTQEFLKGTLINLITKGLSKHAIILSKFAMISFFWTSSYVISAFIQYGYTLYYFNNKGDDKILVYAASWLMGIFLISLILLLSVLFRKTVGVLLGTLAFVVACFASGFSKVTKDYNPLLLIQNQDKYLAGTAQIGDLFKPTLIVILLTIISLAVAIIIFNKSEV